MDHHLNVNIGEKFCDLLLSKELLNDIKNKIHEKNDNWTWKKLKTFALQKM